MRSLPKFHSLSILILMITAGSVQAQTYESLILYNPSTLRNNFDGVVGLEFVASADVDITHLGFYDAGGDGLIDAHEVGLFESNTGVELARATVLPGTDAPYANFCRWVELETPASLSAGTAYTVSAVVTNGGDEWITSGGQTYPPTRLNSNLATWLTDFTISSWQGGLTEAVVPANKLDTAHLNRGYFAGNIAYVRPTDQVAVTVNAGETFQTIRSFGASDAWNPEFVGTFWPQSEKENIARWLFSSEMDANGHPEGIGLSRWRYYIGSGSSDLGAGSGIENEFRRTEGFLTPSGTYDWTRQEGQTWFLEKAVEYGIEEVVGFAVSPPVLFTYNGLGRPGEGYGLKSTLNSDGYDDFADYLADVAQHFETEKGIVFDYLSPVNEPQFSWEESGQDGSSWTNEEIARIVRELNTSINERNLQNTQIFIAEAGRVSFLLDEEDPAHADEAIQAFFDPQRSTYVGDLNSIAPVISYHSYWENTTNDRIKNLREEAASLAASLGIELAQTEYSLLGINEILEGRPGGYLDIAIWQAKVVHSDLRFAEVTSWSYWTSMEQERYNQKNRFELIWLTAETNFDLKTGGSAKPNKTMWAYGNFTRFIRPGYIRIGQTGADDLTGLMGTSWISTDQSELVSVFVNYGSLNKEILLDFQTLPETLQAGQQHVYTTSEVQDLAYMGSVGADQPVEVPGLGVVTVVTELVSDTETLLDTLENGITKHWLGRSNYLEDGYIHIEKPYFWHFGEQSWFYIHSTSTSDNTVLYRLAADGGEWLWMNDLTAPFYWAFSQVAWYIGE